MVRGAVEEAAQGSQIASGVSLEDSPFAHEQFEYGLLWLLYGVRQSNSNHHILPLFSRDHLVVVGGETQTQSGLQQSIRLSTRIG